MGALLEELFGMQVSQPKRTAKTRKTAKVIVFAPSAGNLQKIQAGRKAVQHALVISAGVELGQQYVAAPLLRVRGHIIGHARIIYVGKSQSCMV